MMPNRLIGPCDSPVPSENGQEQGPVYVWTFPGCPVRVHLQVAAIRNSAAELAAPGEGLLIGRATNRTTEVTKLVARRERAIAELAAEYGDEQVVGYYRISRGERLALNGGDLALARSRFRGPHHIFLRAELPDCGPANATFFFHRDGKVDGECALLEFPLDPVLLHSEEWSTRRERAGCAEPEPESVAPQEKNVPVLAKPALVMFPELDSRGPAAKAGPLSLGVMALGLLLIAASGPVRPSWFPDTYTQPLLGIFSMLALAALVWRKRGLGAAALIGFMLVSWPPVEWLLSRPLEARYPVRPFQPPREVQGIVVLSQGVEPPVFERPFPLPDRATYSRCEMAAWIQRNRPDLPVLVSGGASSGQEAPLSRTMRNLLWRAGVPDDRIWTEERSHNTHESAVYSAQILRERGIREIALVVDARSMYRAAACFRKQGIEVVPAPAGFREWGGFAEEILPSWRAVAGNELTLHEAAGIVWYSLNGWI